MFPTTIGFFFGPRAVQGDPGIIGPIASFFGYIIDFIFGVVYAITPAHSLGISIILMTIVARSLMLPLGIKQQKSMMKMRLLNPEIAKIKQKYGNKKDPENQRKMNAEIQAFMAENKINPLLGCLPMLLQMPLFFGLSVIMQQSFRYVTRLGELYTELSTTLFTHVPGLGVHLREILGGRLRNPEMLGEVLVDGERHISNVYVSDLNSMLNAFTPEDWRTLFDRIAYETPAYVMESLQNIYSQMAEIETFFGMSLIEEPMSMWWPGMIIPVLAVASSLAMSYFTSKLMVATDEKSRMQQKMMMFMMPVMMGVMTIGMPIGVGIFWITSTVYHIGQQVLLNKFSGLSPGKEPAEAPVVLPKKTGRKP